MCVQGGFQLSVCIGSFLAECVYREVSAWWVCTGEVFSWMIGRYPAECVYREVSSWVCV